ncbi:MAG: hypothetical protein QM778_22885 [Myxococcales bacterium]
MSANHAAGGVRPSVGLRTELAYQMCAHCTGLYPAIAECVCVYCEAKVCPSCVELIDEIDEVVCVSCGGARNEFQPVPLALREQAFQN